MSYGSFGSCPSNISLFSKKRHPNLSTVQKINSAKEDTVPFIICLLVTPIQMIRTFSKWDVDKGGANQTTWGSENSYSHVLWYCTTIVNIGICRIPTWPFLQCRFSRNLAHIWLTICSWWIFIFKIIVLLRPCCR